MLPVGAKSRGLISASSESAALTVAGVGGTVSPNSGIRNTGFGNEGRTGGSHEYGVVNGS